MKSMEVKTECYEALNKTVSAQTSSGVVYLPKNWVGKQVKVLLMQPIEDVHTN